MKTKYCVGRLIPNMPPALADSYDLDDCPLFDTIEYAVRDLVRRVNYLLPELDLDEMIPLQVLQCKTQRGDVMSYEAIQSSTVIAIMLQMNLIRIRNL